MDSSESKSLNCLQNFTEQW